jgi:hypothetical protein
MAASGRPKAKQDIGPTCSPSGGQNILMLYPIKPDPATGCAPDLSVLTHCNGALIADLAAVRAGVVTGCARCGRRTALELDRACNRGWGGLRWERIPHRCSGCGRVRVAATVHGLGWSVSGFAVGLTEEEAIAAE